MPKIKHVPIWPDLYHQWKDISAWLDSPALEEPQFLQIQSRYVPGRALHIPVDWWPKGEIQERIAFYSRPNYMNPYHTKAGTVNTAELLWQARGNLERQHLVYILASLRDLEKDLPESWRGDPFRLLQDVWWVVKEQFTEDMEYWHHASKNALPIRLFDGYWRSSEMLVPQNSDDLMYMAALEASLSVGNWQLVEFIKEPNTNFRVIK